MAAVGLLVVLGLLGGQVNDAIRGFGDFKFWWTYPKPVFVGDDYIEATITADGKKRWPGHLRSIATGIGAKRLANVRGYRLVVPEPLSQLWTTPSGEKSAPRLDDLFDAITGGLPKSVKYDPHLDEATIRRWRSEGRIERLQWQIEMVTDGQSEHDTVILMTDSIGHTIYVVPPSLLPKVLP